MKSQARWHRHTSLQTFLHHKIDKIPSSSNDAHTLLHTVTSVQAALRRQCARALVSRWITMSQCTHSLGSEKAMLLAQRHYQTANRHASSSILLRDTVRRCPACPCARACDVTVSRIVQIIIHQTVQDAMQPYASSPAILADWVHRAASSGETCLSAEESIRARPGARVLLSGNDLSKKFPGIVCRWRHYKIIRADRPNALRAHNA